MLYSAADVNLTVSQAAAANEAAPADAAAPSGWPVRQLTALLVLS